jgi:hypothetical protein
MKMPFHAFANESIDHSGAIYSSHFVGWHA